MAELDLKKQTLFPLAEAGISTLDDHLSRLEPLKFCPNVRIDYTAGTVYKVRNNLTPDAILQYYGKLKTAGLNVLEDLSFQQCSTGNIEIERYIGPDGAGYLANATDQMSMGFYKDVLCTSMSKVLGANPDKAELDFSIDPNPYNYVFDPATGRFYYIDYEPSVLTQAGGLVHNGFIKFAREKPHLFDNALRTTLDRFPQAEVSDYLRTRPYLAISQLIAAPNSGENQTSKQQLLSRLSEQDDIYGATLLIVLGVSSGCIEKVIENLGNKYTNYVSKLGTDPKIGSREALIKYLTFQIGAKNPVGLRNYLNFILTIE